METAIERIVATNHLDPDESVVRSGLALAEAVLDKLSLGQSVIVSLEGLKGASSSYFNVFFRRILEGCGLAEIGNHIRFEFASSIQKMVFERSLEAISKRPVGLTDESPKDQESGKPLRRSLWRRLFPF